MTSYLAFWGPTLAASYEDEAVKAESGSLGRLDRATSPSSVLRCSKPRLKSQKSGKKKKIYINLLYWKKWTWKPHQLCWRSNFPFQSSSAFPLTKEMTQLFDVVENVLLTLKASPFFDQQEILIPKSIKDRSLARHSLKIPPWIPGKGPGQKFLAFFLFYWGISLSSFFSVLFSKKFLGKRLSSEKDHFFAAETSSYWKVKAAMKTAVKFRRFDQLLRELGEDRLLCSKKTRNQRNYHNSFCGTKIFFWVVFRKRKILIKWASKNLI